MADGIMDEDKQQRYPVSEFKEPARIDNRSSTLDSKLTNNASQLKINNPHVNNQSNHNANQPNPNFKNGNLVQELSKELENLVLKEKPMVTWKEVIGLDVDEDTGLVYCTTYHNDFRVYDSNLSLHDTEPNDINGPAGVAVGGLYKPPFPLLTLVKDDNGVDCAYPWNEIDENYLVYNICYDANGHADTNVFITAA